MKQKKPSQFNSYASGWVNPSRTLVEQRFCLLILVSNKAWKNREISETRREMVLSQNILKKYILTRDKNKSLLRFLKAAVNRNHNWLRPFQGKIISHLFSRTGYYPTFSEIVSI